MKTLNNNSNPAELLGEVFASIRNLFQVFGCSDFEGQSYESTPNISDYSQYYWRIENDSSKIIFADNPNNTFYPTRFDEMEYTDLYAANGFILIRTYMNEYRLYTEERRVLGKETKIHLQKGKN